MALDLALSYRPNAPPLPLPKELQEQELRCKQCQHVFYRGFWIIKRNVDGEKCWFGNYVCKYEQMWLFERKKKERINVSGMICSDDMACFHCGSKEKYKYNI